MSYESALNMLSPVLRADYDATLDRLHGLHYDDSGNQVWRDEKRNMNFTGYDLDSICEKVAEEIIWEWKVPAGTLWQDLT